MLFSNRSYRLMLASAFFASSLALAATTRAADQGRPGEIRAEKLGAAQVSSGAFTTRTVSVTFEDSEEFMPPLVRGDREFGGNGPEVTIRARFYTQGNRVYRRIYMRAAETRITAGFLTSKPSVAAGWSRPRVVYIAPKGWAVRRFGRTERRLPEYIDTDHAPDRFQSPIGDVTVWGDSDGNDIGRTTRVRVDWDYRLSFVIERRADVATPIDPPGKPEG